MSRHKTPRWLREARYEPWPEAQRFRAIQESVAPRRRGNYSAALISAVALLMLVGGAWLLAVMCADLVHGWYR